EQEGRSVVSSQELGTELGVTPAQIRKDLSYFGRFGKQGRGYSVHRLADELRQILGLDTRWRVAVVGIGRLGRAIASHPGFEGLGFAIASLHAASPSLVGTEIGGRKVRHVSTLKEDLERNPVDIGIVAVPREGAQEVVDTLVNAGV